MSANIIETAMAIGIQWSEAPRLLLHGNGSTGDYYAYLLEILIVIDLASIHWCLLSIGIGGDQQGIPKPIPRRVTHLNNTVEYHLAHIDWHARSGCGVGGKDKKVSEGERDKKKP
ncbi:Uncharacterized protein TCM_043450 [Theobroma cacao]|uniref:Uncharacterized protein n=1 Tax=Theobroma cacao TaxID=3641 RepID=A0A061FQI3_THECC|nr:Uncharacterized protein TCM_043450 [Theobroma cacao]